MTMDSRCGSGRRRNGTRPLKLRSQHQIRALFVPIKDDAHFTDFKLTHDCVDLLVQGPFETAVVGPISAHELFDQSTQ